MIEIEAKSLKTAVSCCGSMIVIRSKGNKFESWTCPCGKKHDHMHIDALCIEAKKGGGGE